MALVNTEEVDGPLQTHDQMLPAGADIPIRRRNPSSQLLLLLSALLKTK